ncbi:hypothetical protein BJ138DRAFT_1179667 [Hygrophoropsis aurantiaca]|uniref:Uncharacterized protein n=1 Tax=Hygrophoropsis aurantiaca TaxID=72124 RepID=A0ACB8AEM2_9AGAM|nr:hypothetical protein BJ138DRAFT_1179667 [Hygrophoropsis aurantiaca]
MAGPNVDSQMRGIPNLNDAQVADLLRDLPGVLVKTAGQNEGDAGLQALAQAGYSVQGSNQHQIPHTTHQLPGHHSTFSAQGLPGPNDPGPSSHPRGPPNLGQLSAVAAAAVHSPMMNSAQQGHETEEGASDTEETDPKPKSSGTSGGRSRNRGGAAMGTDEWTRQRKDNHKEVERRRRGNINEGINELGRIVPNSSGEKAKGAILSRAVQYIHHLKENEARNIEKWTLEKLLMDQAMGDLQAQLEEMRRLWEEERIARQRAESELDVLRGVSQGSGKPATTSSYKSRSRSVEHEAGPTNRSPFGESEMRTEMPDDNNTKDDGESRPGKRARED